MPACRLDYARFDKENKCRSYFPRAPGVWTHREMVEDELHRDITTGWDSNANPMSLGATYSSEEPQVRNYLAASAHGATIDGNPSSTGKQILSTTSRARHPPRTSNSGPPHHWSI